MPDVNEIVNIAFNSDDNYAPYLIILLERILSLRASEYPIKFYILDGGICHKNKNYMYEKIIQKHKNADISFIKIDIEEYDGLPKTVDYISPITYARLNITEYLKEINKVIYLDIDIVVNQDIQILWNQNTEGFAIAACKDPYIENLNSDYKKIIGLSEQQIYFNAGIIVFNLDICRKMDLFSKCIEWSMKYDGIFKYQDQDILNGVLAGNVKYLNSRFNFTINHLGLVKKKIKIDVEKPICIYHHVGSGKPWHNTSLFNGCRQFYKTFLNLENRESIRITTPSLKIRIKRVIKEIKNKYIYNIY